MGLSDIELGRFNNRWLGSVVIVWLRVWLIDVELGRFDNSASGVKTEAPPPPTPLSNQQGRRCSKRISLP